MLLKLCFFVNKAMPISKLEQLFNKFINEVRYSEKLRPETIKGYQSSFDLLNKTFENLTLEMLTSDLMIEFFRQLDTRKRIVGKGIVKVGIKRSTVQTYRNKLNRFFKWLVENEYIEKNPFDKMKYPVVEYEDLKYLKRNEVMEIFNCITYQMKWKNNFVKKRNIAIFSTLLYTGVRRGELLGLRIQDVNLEEMVLFVRGETSKSKKDRQVPINSQLRLVLEDYLQERNKKVVASDCLFLSNNLDSGISADGLKHLISKVNKELDFSFHCHRFRHTYAVNLYSNGSDAYTIKVLLGHKDIRMTEKYLRAMPTKSFRVNVERVNFDNLI